MYLDYPSLMVVILVSTFELLLVALVKSIKWNGIVLVLLTQGIILFLLLILTITVNQVQLITLISARITSTTPYGMEQDVREVHVVMVLPNLGSIVS